MDFAWRTIGPNYLQTVLAEPHQVRASVAACIREHGGKISASRDENLVWQVSSDSEHTDCVNKIICGTFHLYSALIAAGLYAYPHPLEVPLADRTLRRLPGSKGSPIMSPRFRFRIAPPANSALRTDSSRFIPLIIPALIEFGAPPPIIMMTEVMIEGFARGGEEPRLTVFDWWTGSQFETEIDTPNKGDGELRSKFQSIQPKRRDRLEHYFDHDRIKIARDREALAPWHELLFPPPRGNVSEAATAIDEPRGHTLATWRKFLSDPRIPLKDRQRVARQAPLFPNHRGGFYTRSGFVDTWYRPAMKAAGLPTRTHYPRHCGINDFLTYVRGLDISEPLKQLYRLEFAKSIGWKWPLVMLERYSLPERRQAQISVARAFHQQRSEMLAALAGGAGSILTSPPPAPVSKLARFTSPRKEAA